MQACRVQPEACKARTGDSQFHACMSQAVAHHERVVDLSALLDDNVQLDDEQLPQLHQLLALLL